jgi:hypothetical protein
LSDLGKGKQINAQCRIETVLIGHVDVKLRDDFNPISDFLRSFFRKTGEKQE